MFNTRLMVHSYEMNACNCPAANLIHLYSCSRTTYNIGRLTTYDYLGSYSVSVMFFAHVHLRTLINNQYEGREPWSSGYGRRLTS